MEQGRQAPQRLVWATQQVREQIEHIFDCLPPLHVRSLFEVWIASHIVAHEEAIKPSSSAPRGSLKRALQRPREAAHQGGMGANTLKCIKK